MKKRIFQKQSDNNVHIFEEKKIDFDLIKAVFIAITK